MRTLFSDVDTVALHRSVDRLQSTQSYLPTFSIGYATENTHQPQLVKRSSRIIV